MHRGEVTGQVHTASPTELGLKAGLSTLYVMAPPDRHCLQPPALMYPAGPPGSASKDSSRVSFQPGAPILPLSVTLSLSVQVSVLVAKAPKPFQLLHGQTQGWSLYIYCSLDPRDRLGGGN